MIDDLPTSLATLQGYFSRLSNRQSAEILHIWHYYFIFDKNGADFVESSYLVLGLAVIVSGFAVTLRNPVLGVGAVLLYGVGLALPSLMKRLAKTKKPKIDSSSSVSELENVAMNASSAEDVNNANVKKMPSVSTQQNKQKFTQAVRQPTSQTIEVKIKVEGGSSQVSAPGGGMFDGGAGSNFGGGSGNGGSGGFGENLGKGFGGGGLDL